jgi:hypothetical protein
MQIDRTLRQRKQEVLAYFRDRASESLATIRIKYAENQPNERASAINQSVNQTKNSLIETLIQTATRDNWTNQEKLESILMLTYCSNVVMIDSRNALRQYNFMDFSRRVGELWDPFCQLCFTYPINDVSLFIPPLFSEAKRALSTEIEDYINALSITPAQKEELKGYYNKVWSFVTSGEIQLELDLHFIYQEQKYVVDFKSGFGSNEKGNTNRLLLVASIYKSLQENYNCMLLVRSNENNNYFNTLKNSGAWEAYSGGEAYDKIFEFSGYNLRTWIDTNIDWLQDLDISTVEHLRSNDLTKFLIW